MKRLITIATVAALLSACASVPYEQHYTPTSAPIGNDVIPNVLPSPTGKDQWVLFEINISPVDGKLIEFKAVTQPDPIACVKQLEWASGEQKGAPAKFRLCRLFDKNGKAVDEVKVDPLGKPLDKNADTEQPDAPKQET